jgi:hypothetical protein
LRFAAGRIDGSSRGRRRARGREAWDGITSHVGTGGGEAAGWREIDGTEGMALQQRRGTAAVLGGELPGQGRERGFGGESEGMKVGQTRRENDQDDSYSSSSSNSELSASMDAGLGAAGVTVSLGPSETRAKFRERKLA